ncbi:site-2 protease family protein [Cerasicoccus maritimus]|uniref:site-2 protease family protein n=1 Tax=Cerasicoccus maritimus TaxID=490089 RepID=UPI0028526A71|nr:site-2 protease family protein [Cerasicoccus maritimus]
MGEPTIFDMLFSSAWGIFWVLLIFNGSIVVHELGHYLAARWRGLKVERFSLFGLGPKLISWHGKDGVEYCICAIPFGAYVALPQLAEMKALEGGAEPKEKLPPIGYADKMYVAFAGPFFNLCLAVVIACIGWYTGYPSNSSGETNVVGYVGETVNVDEDTVVDGPAWKAGLRPGDEIIAIDGEPIASFKEVKEHITLGTGRNDAGEPSAVLSVKRGDEVLDLTVNPVLKLDNSKSGDRMRFVGIGPAETLTVDRVLENSPEAQAGIEVGDVIVNVDGTPVFGGGQYLDQLSANVGQPTPLVVQRGDEQVTLTMTPQEIPYNRPDAHIALNADGPTAFWIIPKYTQGETGDLAATTTASKLAVYSLDPGEGFLKSDGNWFVASVNGESMGSLQQFLDYTQAHQGEELTFALTNADGATITRMLPAAATVSLNQPVSTAHAGFQTKSDVIFIKQNPLVQFKEHIQRTFRTLGSLISPKSDIGLRHLSGPVGITTNLYRIAQFDWRLAFWFGVLLNINLAVLNLLPIPVLDGGHMVFATISKLTGKPLPINFIASVQGAFMFLLLGVMFYVLYFDSMREVGYHEERRAWELELQRRIPLEFRPDRSTN